MQQFGRILGYGAIFLVILVLVTIALWTILPRIGWMWPPLVERGVSVIVTWLIFWFGVWRPMSRRAERRRSEGKPR